jgi:LuxR family maltose regulon positive regulatory protein
VARSTTGAPVGLPRQSIQRTSLLETLDGVAPGGIGLLVAPAGFGKSVLLSQWMATVTDRRCCYVEAHAGLNDPERLRAVLEACSASAADGSGRAEGAPRSAPPAELRVVGDPASERHDLVIDDLHEITSEPSLAVVAELITGLSAPNRMFLASREDPSLPLHRRRPDGSLTELRQHDLSLTADEVEQFVALVAGRELPRDQAEVLRTRTDGWPVGVQLAAVALQTAGDRDGFVAGFSGTLRSVSEYLLAEVLAQQPDDLRAFLLATSVLPELTAGACDAVAQRTDSASVLRELERRSVFVVRLDEFEDRFRYHHLFADMLRHTLAASDPDGRRAASRRAVDWYRSADEPGAAIDQLLALGAFDSAFELVLDHGRRWYEQGDGTRLSRWMEAIAASTTPPPATIELARLMTQIASDEWPAAIETCREVGRRDDLTPDQRAVAAAYHAGLGHYDIPASEVIEASDRASAAMAAMDGELDLFGLTDPGSLEQLTTTLQGLAHFHLGGHDEAVRHLRQVAASAPARYPLWEAHSLASLALVLAWCGRLHEAQQHADVALGLVADLGRPEHKAVDDARLAVALVAYEHDDLVAAAERLATARQLAERSRRTANLEAVGVLEARLVARTEGVNAALDAVRQGPSGAILRPALVAARTNLEARLWLASGDPASAARTLERFDPAPSTLPARIEVALRRGDLDVAASLVETWSPAVADARSQVERLLWQACVEGASGDAGSARVHAADALERADSHGMRRVILEVPDALDLLPRVNGGTVWPSANSELAGIAGASQPDMPIEALTARELAVLPYLPTRLTNAELAGELYVSVNTVKSHLRSIYRKLGVADRDAAVSAAQARGFL